MKTIILGICEVNRRQYFCGLWPTIMAAKADLGPVYQIELQSNSVDGGGYNAVAVYYAQDVWGDKDEPDEFKGTCLTEEQGFSLYEIPANKLPGYMPFDED